MTLPDPQMRADPGASRGLRLTRRDHFPVTDLRATSQPIPDSPPLPSPRPRDPATGSFLPTPPDGVPAVPELSPVTFPGTTARDAIPGAHGCTGPRATFRLHGVLWTRGDGDVWSGAPIGLALALEAVGGAA